MNATAKSVDSGDEVSLDRLLQDIQALEGITAGWEENYRNSLNALVNAHADLHRVALVRLIRRLKQDPGAVEILKQAMSDDVIYAMLRRHQIVRPSLQERLEDALQTVRPYLEGHGGNVELVKVTPPDRVEIRLLGACDGCPASALTLREGVEKAIREHCPEITRIDRARGGIAAKPVDGVTVNFVSPFARSEDAGWIYACRLDEIPEKRLRRASIDDNDVILSRFDERVTCYQNACAHLGMPLDEGEITDAILTCPHHGFQFSLESGECLTVPEVQLHTHAVRVVGDRVEVKIQ